MIVYELPQKIGLNIRCAFNLIFDEYHHLPTDFFRVIAEYAIAPYRLGLTATLIAPMAVIEI